MFSRSFFLKRCKTRAFHSQYKNTIYALSSGHGKCGVAVVRVSGPEASNALKLMAGFTELPKPRCAHLRSLRNPESGEVIDKGLVLWFAGPESFTGEDTCEFQIHGGLAVINGILASLNSLASFRIAEPGEFTKRAFFNGKLDLTEVEGLSDLLNAETEYQRKQAFLQSQGCLSERYLAWKETLTRNLAHWEASIDFEESEMLDEHQDEIVRKDVENLRISIVSHLNDGRRAETLRTGVKAVIVGKPNVGKSSLLNALCGRPAAIVTPISGTTRDVLEIKLDISGYPLILTDTAGLREDSPDPIEREGIRRAFSQLECSDLLLVMSDANDFHAHLSRNPNSTMDEYFGQYLKTLNITSQQPTLFVMNKVDLFSKIGENVENLSLISCKTDKGIDDFVGALTLKLKQICGEPSKEHPSMNNARHREHLRDCLKELELFLNSTNGNDAVISAEHLRRASRNLGKLIGTVTADELLDVIFRDFCIGK